MPITPLSHSVTREPSAAPYSPMTTTLLIRADHLTIAADVFLANVPAPWDADTRRAYRNLRRAAHSANLAYFNSRADDYRRAASTTV